MSKNKRKADSCSDLKAVAPIDAEAELTSILSSNTAVTCASDYTALTVNDCITTANSATLTVNGNYSTDNCVQFNGYLSDYVYSPITISTPNTYIGTLTVDGGVGTYTTLAPIETEFVLRTNRRKTKLQFKL